MVLVVKLPAAANEYKFKLPIQLGVTNLSHFVIPHFLQSEFYLSSRLQRNFERIPKPSGYSSQNSCKTQLRQKSIWFCKSQVETSELMIWTIYSVHRFTTTASNGLLCGRIHQNWIKQIPFFADEIQKSCHIFDFWSFQIWIYYNMSRYRFHFVNSCTFGKNLAFFGITRLNFS